MHRRALLAIMLPQESPANPRTLVAGCPATEKKAL
jgi:hypothetical protein